MDWFGASELGDRLVGLVEHPGFVPAAFLIAFVAGAVHAVGPGHGKTLAAAYLVGSRGRVRDAAWLGGTVAAMHTVSVLVVAIAWAFFDLSGLVRMETLTTGLQLIAGLIVIALGMALFVRYRRGLRGFTHSHGGIRHAHGPARVHAHRLHHGHGHNHQHEPDHDHDAPTRPTLVMLGLAGGLTPSPAAFLLLVTGIFSGRSGFALLLVMAFGVGLAVVLFGVGLLALAGKNVVVAGARSRAVLAVAAKVTPALAAVSVTLVGLGLSGLAVGSLVAAS